jgi:hypothetical protein
MTDSADGEPLSPWLHARVDATAAALGPEWIVVDSSFAAQLTTTHERTFELAANNVLTGPEQLTSTIPNVQQAQLDTLDERGLVRVGERVGPGSLLIGRVTPSAHSPLSPEEKLLRAIFGEVASDVEDSSLRCPPGCFGVVREAQLIEPGKHERARARVTIGWQRPLAIGDELLIEGQRRVVVASIAALAGDVAWRGASGSIRLAKASAAHDVIHGRSIGPYSGVTQRPLAGKEQFGGQLLTAAQARRLADKAAWTLWELLTIKSDSVLGRMRSYEALVKLENPRPREHDGVELPESLHVMSRELAALGLGIQLEAERVGVRLLDAAQLRERSRGRVLRAETINYRTLAPEPDGLFCQRIFGPAKDYACACGKYGRMKYIGTVCEVCGVEVTHSKVRRERFGHIELAAPVVHPLFVAEVARTLGLSLAQLRRVLAGKLGLDHDARPIPVDDELARTGAAVVCELLGERDCKFVLQLLLVLPPELRPLVPLDGGQFASSDLNDLYARVINRNNRIRRLLELAAPITIVRSDAIELQALVDTLFANELRKKPARSEGRVLRSLFGNVEQRLVELACKRVDFSAVARLVADPTVPARACRLPRSLATELFRPIAYGLMETHHGMPTIRAAKRALEAEQPFALAAIEQASRDAPVLLMSSSSIVARTVTLWDEAAIAVDPDTARLLATLDVTLHLPLTEEARAECLALEDDPPPLELQPSGWLSRALAEPSAALQQLQTAALAGELDELTDPLLRPALGRPPA